MGVRYSNLLLLVGAIVAGFTDFARAVMPSGDELVRVALIADAAKIEAGKPFDVGVVFKISPNYHIYWINPGDSGQAPGVKWKLPEGFTASELRWPVPKKFMLPGAIFNFGYEGEVTLLATITPPASLPAGAPEISAECDWLVCDENACLPGTGTATLATGGNAGEQSKLEAAAASVPVPAEKSGDVLRIVTTEAGEERGARIEWKQPVGRVEFFPRSGDGVKIQSSSLSTNKISNPPVTRVEIVAEPTAGTAPGPFSIPGVIAYEDSTGQRRGIEVTIPARNP